LLKWNDHHNLFFAGAEQLYQGEEFTDVVLSAGSQTFKAHKLVLSICSPFFQNLFRKLGPEKHVIFLKDISTKHLELLLQYMYVGEIKVKEDELVTVLNVAQSLEIRGLTDNSESKQTSSSSSNITNSALLPPPMKRKILSKPSSSSLVQNINQPRPMGQQQSQPFTPSSIKMEHETSPVIDIESHDHGDEGEGYLGNEDGQAFQGAAPVVATEEVYEGYDEAYDQGEGGYYEAHGDKMGILSVNTNENESETICPICKKDFHCPSKLNQHLPVHTGEKRYECSYCRKRFTQSSNLNRHVRTHHTKEMC